MDKNKMIDHDVNVWEMVKTLEEQFGTFATVVSSCRSTMMVNFGPEAKTYPNVVNADDTLPKMMLYGFEHLHSLVKDKESELNNVMQWLRMIRRWIPVDEKEVKTEIDKIVDRYYHSNKNK